MGRVRHHVAPVGARLRNRGEGRGRVWCTVHAKALPVQQFFKAKGYRLLGPAEEDETTRLPGQLIFERML